ncbi:hypothetical protein LshimejAT787_0504840 [Lyophyllum shimeji]|uniref:Uncharacterized protein n=1 Tax=Lyophyllum shimeji TaxID=47721 RepID=A0A9P3UKX6_LYOSH|nr:hypothetical protein LshimejAT787_0504840 [Lyophyllum shimeji]
MLLKELGWSDEECTAEYVHHKQVASSRAESREIHRGRAACASCYEANSVNSKRNSDLPCFQGSPLFVAWLWPSLERALLRNPVQMVPKSGPSLGEAAETNVLKTT